jgi:hypothetical protein
MKRLDYLQQKLPHSLHETGMLEGSELSVCSILHNTFAAIPISPCRHSSVLPSLIRTDLRYLPATLTPAWVGSDEVRSR